MNPTYTWHSDIIMQYSRGKSALIFCSTRKGAQEAAQCLSQSVMALGFSNPFIKSKQQHDRLKEASMSCSDKQMQSCIPYGVGYHNGGLSLKDRNLAENLFLNGDIQILCTTNTLAHGINLPAHTVVIKSTQYFNKETGLYMEYDRSTILQMCGRAGRPPFDDTGMVIIMTRRETVHLYENLLSGCEIVESQLLSCITEHLNAEIVQLAVSDIIMAIEWLKCSFLYVRLRKNPESYGIKRNVPWKVLEKHIQDICMGKVNELYNHGMISMDEDGFLLKSQEPGRLMANYYLKFDTMINIVHAPESCSLEDVLHIICRSEEFSWIQLRRNEKKLLNDVNYDKDGRLRFHIIGENGKKKRRIQTREEKIFVLANDCLTGDPMIHDLSLSQDVGSICSNGCRIAKCMKECFIYRKSYKGALNSALLAKCLHHRLWDTSPYLLKQLSGIGMVTAKALHSVGIKSFTDLEGAEPRKMEIITGRKYPFGNHIKESLSSLPSKIDIKIREDECRRQGKVKLLITLIRTSQGTSLNKRHYADMVVGSEEDNLILSQVKLRVEEFSSPYMVTVMVSCPQHGKVTVKVDLIFEEYVGLDIHEKHVVTGQIRSTLPYPGQISPSAYTLPKEISILECNQGSKHNITRPVQDSTKILSPMPNFELLPEQEEVEELPTECDKDDDCQLITEQTVFEHIRKKSKNFPVLMKSNAMDSSYDPLILKRKCSLRNKHSSPAGGLSSGGIILIDSPPACASLVANVGAASTLSSFNVSPIQLDNQENFQSDSHGTIGCSWKFSTPSNAKNIAFSRISPIAEKRLGGSSVHLTSGNDKVVENVDGSSMPNIGKEQESLFSGFKSVFSFL